MSQKMVFKVAIAVIVVLVAIVACVYFFKPQWVPQVVAQQEPLPKAVTIDTTGQPTLGSPGAPMQIVAFEDIKCFNCRLFDVQLLPWIVESYVDTGKATYTMINVAFISGSMQAAVAARCVYKQEPKLFFKYIDLLYHNQGAENESWASTAKLLQWSHQIDGVNQEKFSECLLDSSNVNTIINNTQYGMDLMDGQLATPAIYVNGVLVRPLTKERFQQIVNMTNK